MSRGPFFDRLRAAQAKFDPHGQGAWYRGIKKHDYKLEPSYLRYPKLRRTEHNLVARFTRQGARLLDTKDRWEQLAFMQHYGVPTKLMDWTTNVTAAIYFALAFRVKSKAELDKPYICVLNPFCLNGLTGVRKIYDNLDEPPTLKLEGQKGNDWPYELPIAIAVDWRNIRIEHQQGVFTYHGKCTKALDEVTPAQCLGKVEINEEEIDDLIDHLRDAGVTHFRMLQDADSLGQDIKEGALRDGILWKGARMPLSEGSIEDESG
jgi:FRG domain